jgi:hypothetical protein
VRILLRVALVMGALLWPRLATADIVYIYDALDRLARVIREDGEAGTAAGGPWTMPMTPAAGWPP